MRGGVPWDIGRMLAKNDKHLWSTGGCARRQLHQRRGGFIRSQSYLHDDFRVFDVLVLRRSAQGVLEGDASRLVWGINNRSVRTARTATTRQSNDDGSRTELQQQHGIVNGGGRRQPFLDTCALTAGRRHEKQRKGRYNPAGETICITVECCNV